MVKSTAMVNFFVTLVRHLPKRTHTRRTCLSSCLDLRTKSTIAPLPIDGYIKLQVQVQVSTQSDSIPPDFVGKGLNCTTRNFEVPLPLRLLLASTVYGKLKP